MIGNQITVVQPVASPMTSTTQQMLATNARANLRQHGKSFAWAARFLGREQADAGARLYAICRAIDDMADDNPPEQARTLLTSLRGAIAHAPVSEPLAADVAHQIVELERCCPLNRQALMDLIDGVEQDLEPVRIADEAALIRYAYRVAGTVGLMMCNVLGITDPIAHRHAVDLGIGMQLTNIARDVLEDAKQDRRYLPGSWVPFDPNSIVSGSANTQEQVVQAIKRLLDLAELYYASGRDGLGYLPRRPRAAIAIAASVYRAIGQQLKVRNYDYLQGRVVVPSSRKAMITIGVLVNPRLYRGNILPHDQNLHTALTSVFKQSGAGHADA